MSARTDGEEIERLCRYLSNAQREIGILRAFAVDVATVFQQESFEPEDFEDLAKKARRILDHTGDGK